MAWHYTFEIEDRHLVALVEHDDGVYLFSDAGIEDASGVPRGLEGWYSSDGIRWEKVGRSIGTQYQVIDVVSTPHGLMAYGIEIETGGLTVWLGDQGHQWEKSDLAADPDLPTGVGHYPYAAHGSKDVLLVFAGQQTHDPINDALVERFGEPVLRYGWGIADVSTGAVTIQGPWGMTMFRITAEELGLEKEDLVSRLTEPARFLTSWRSTDGVSWERRSTEFQHVQSVFAGPDGRIWTEVFSARGGVVATTDGIEWQVVTPNQVGVSPWPGHDQFIRVLDSAFGPEILVSEDVMAWESLNVAELFPDELLTAFPTVGAGPLGLAAVFESRLPGRTDEGDLIVEKEGFTLSGRTREPFQTVLRQGEVTILEVGRWDHVLSPHTVFDVDRETVTFLDPESNDELVTFTFDELAQAETAAQSQPLHETHHLLVFSEDGARWTIQDVTDLVEAGDDGQGGGWPSGHVSTIHVGGSELIMAVQDHESGRLTIWSARP